jgi:beta-1,4-mannosyltransferase
MTGVHQAGGDLRHPNRALDPHERRVARDESVVTAATDPDRLVVLESFPGPRPTTNPYLVQLVHSLPPDVQTMTFTWRRALTAPYDLFHVHWPENLPRGTTRARTAARRALTAALLLRLAVRRTPMVRTLHNTGPHEPGGRLERALLRWFDRRTTLWIRLTPSTVPPSGAAVVTIPHGHYRDWFADLPVAPAEPGRVLYFGLVRPYKGVEDLLDAFLELPDPEVRLRLVGRTTQDSVRERVECAMRADPRIGVRLEYVTDAELADEVSRAALVVLPYRRLHNSGAAILALSLGRPVLLPSGSTAEELTAEVGPGWIRTFTPPLTSDALAAALVGANDPGRAPAPDLSWREWRDAGEAHAAAFRTAVGLARRGGRR